MKTKLAFLPALVAFALVGCQPVLLDRPLGTSVREDLSKRFDGIWQTEDGQYIFHVRARANGLLDVAGIEWRDERFVLRDTTCLVTRLGDAMYLNVPLAPDSVGRRMFLFAPFVGDEDGNLMTALIPSYDFFAGAVERKELTGSVVGHLVKRIEIRKLDEDFFREHASEVILSADPVVLKRTRRGVIKSAWPGGE